MSCANDAMLTASATTTTAATTVTAATAQNNDVGQKDATATTTKAYGIILFVMISIMGQNKRQCIN